MCDLDTADVDTLTGILGQVDDHQKWKILNVLSKDQYKRKQVDTTTLLYLYRTLTGGFRKTIQTFLEERGVNPATAIMQHAA